MYRENAWKKYDAENHCIHVSGRSKTYHSAVKILNPNDFLIGHNYFFSMKAKHYQTEGENSQIIKLTLYYKTGEGIDQADKHYVEMSPYFHGEKDQWVDVIANSFTIPEGHTYKIYVEFPDSMTEYDVKEARAYEVGAELRDGKLISSQIISIENCQAKFSDYNNHDDIYFPMLF